MKITFSDSDRESIRRAVETAETRTSGEIVPFVIDRCDDYEVAVWRGAVLAAAFGLVAALLFLRIYEGWGFAWLHTPWGPATVALVFGLVGAGVVTLIPGMRRALAGPSRLAENVHNRAMRAFVEEEVFKTRDRTGILLFISLFERRIEVLGDEGINRAVSDGDWVDVVQTVRAGIRSGQITDGIVEAISKCGVLLKDHGLEIQPDDTDELSNRLRFESDD
ncbi:MAG: TPM domain-containing protein [Rhodothermales bacterium]|nr:TPM domain-containing protein [Rhodothermales bacterium]